MEDEEITLKSLIAEALKKCEDVELLDLIYKLLISSKE